MHAGQVHINAHLHMNPQDTAGQYAEYKNDHDGTMFCYIFTVVVVPWYLLSTVNTM